MDYLKLYKKRVGSTGSSAKEFREIEAKKNIERNIKLMQGHHSANLYNRDHFDEKKGPSIMDVVVRSGASELEKTIMFCDGEDVVAGSYIQYNNKTYIVREVNTDLIMPTAKGFLCNQYITFKDFGDIWCYTNSTTYGSKGIISADKFYELDSRTKIYIQKNNITDNLEIGNRIMLANKYVYRITEFDDAVFPNVFIMVCQRDENNILDDFENNLAWNEEYKQEQEDTPVESLVLTGKDEIKINQTQQYDSNIDVTWEIDDLDSVEIVNSTTRSILLKGLKANWVALTATNGDEIATKDIMVYK